MNLKRKAILFAGMLLTVASAVAALPTRGESSTVYQWSVSPQTENCGGGCGARTLCCKIVVEQ